MYIYICMYAREEISYLWDAYIYVNNGSILYKLIRIFYTRRKIYERKYLVWDIYIVY